MRGKYFTKFGPLGIKILMNEKIIFSTNISTSLNKTCMIAGVSFLYVSFGSLP